jgi:membrane protein
VSPKDIFALLKDTFKAWSDDKASRLGAALAYYTIFSIGPLILLSVAIAGAVFGAQAAQGQIIGAIQGVTGQAGAQVIQDALKNAAKPGAGIASTIIGTGTLLLGAAGLFGQLQDALNTIWGVKAKASGIGAMIRERLLTFVLVLGTGILLLAVLLVNALLALLHDAFANAIPGGAFVLQILNYIISFVLITLVFGVTYKVLPDVEIRWRDVWIGAAVTSLLFLLGQFALAFYLSVSNPGSAYGAAGALVIVLVWIYYTAQIVFLGAEFTQVYADRYGADIQPSKNAVWVTGEERAKLGLEGTKTSGSGPAGKGKKSAPAAVRGLRFFGPTSQEPAEDSAPVPASVVATANEHALPARESATVVGAALVPVLALWLGRLALRRPR